MITVNQDNYILNAEAKTRTDISISSEAVWNNMQINRNISQKDTKYRDSVSYTADVQWP